MNAKAMIHGLLMSVGLAMGGLSMLATPAQAQRTDYWNLNCNQLWYERNLIYANRGYCFQTQRAIRTFGPRCYPPYGQLTDAEHRRVAEIIRWERRRGCR